MRKDLSVIVTARSVDEARERVHTMDLEDELRSKVREGGYLSISVDDYDIDTVEED